MNARELSDGWDVCLVHDPQPAALLQARAREGQGLGVALPHRRLDAQPGHDRPAAALHRGLSRSRCSTCADYVPQGMKGKVNVVPPAIDPLTPKNMALSPEDGAFVCGQFGIDVDRPLICQVSRFDPWKDPLGVIDAYRQVKEPMPEVQLALVGSMASDDPEGWDFFNATIAHADGDPDIHILNNFNNVGAIEVNAFQSHADVLIQKSTREGFGLTVSEAIWKARPFIGGDVGGIPLQIEDGVTGFLVSSVEQCAERTLEILRDPALGQGARPARQGARAPALPDAALPARLPAHLQRAAERHEPRRRHSGLRWCWSATAGRSPSTPAARSSAARGGLVTALTGLASHRDAIWIASAMSEHDAEVSREHGGRAVPGAARRRAASTRCAWSSATPTPTTASTTCSPTRCCGSSSTTCGISPTRRTSAARRSRPSSSATTSSTRTSRARSSRRSRASSEPVVMVHDYHLYTLPDLVRRARPDVFLHHFIHIPWTQPDAWRVLPTRIREEIYAGLLANDIIGFHTRSYRRNFLQCCRDLMDLEVDFERGRRALRRARGVGARLPAADRPPGDPRSIAQRERVDEFERELLRRRRDFLILRVDRADLSQERAARLLRLRPVPRAAPRVQRARHVHRPADAVANRRARSTPSTSSGSRRSWRSSTTATARPTGCRSS